jgi:penicillin-binding protein
VESDVAGPATVTPKDEFPPAPPAGLAVSVSGDSIELSWQRNMESDFKEYRVYRSMEDGPFERLAAGLEAPGYSDRKLLSGKRYRYRVTAVDQSVNESDPSSIVEAVAP